MNAGDISYEFDNIDQLYKWIDRMVKPFYLDLDIFRTFERVFNAYFTWTEEYMQLRNTEELRNGCVKLADYLNATYRHKKQKEN